MKINIVSEQERLNRTMTVNNRQLVTAMVVCVIYFRFLFVQERSFSYDYEAYIIFFRGIKDLGFDEILRRLSLTAPYVLVNEVGVLEFGFVLLVRVLEIWFSPYTTYAILAAASVGLRTYVIRSLGLSWPLIMLIQMYSISLFEANALRAGLALSLSLLALYCLSRNKKMLGVIAVLASASQHLQALIFWLPFAGVLAIQLRWLRGLRGMLILGPLGAIVLWQTIKLLGKSDFGKIRDYVNTVSGASGLNLFTIFSLLFLIACLKATVISARQRKLNNEKGRRSEGALIHEALWIRTMYASIPALMLTLFATNFSTIGVRAWQFSFVIIATTSFLIPTSNLDRQLKTAALYLLLTVSLTNNFLRYPLSNFFSPPLPYADIVPLWQ